MFLNKIFQHLNINLIDKYSQSSFILKQKKKIKNSSSFSKIINHKTNFFYFLLLAILRRTTLTTIENTKRFQGTRFTTFHTFIIK